MKHKITIVIICIILTLLVLVYFNPLDEDDKLTDDSPELVLELNQPYQVTNDSAYQDNAAIYGDRLVWQDDRHGNWDIYMFNITTGKKTRITTEPHDQVEPKIYGDLLVWKDTRNVQGPLEKFPSDYNSDIYLFNLVTGTERPLTTNDQCQTSPEIYGENIVWLDYRSDRFEVYLYNLSNEKELKLSNSPTNCTGCRIFRDTVIWSIESNDTAQVFRYRISTGEVAELKINSTGKIERLHFNNEHLVWNAKPSEGINIDIYLYNFSSEETVQVTTNESYQYNSIISGNYIFWTDLRNDPDGWKCPCKNVLDNITFDNWDIYMYDLSTGLERQVTSSADSEILTDINESFIVYTKIIRFRKDIHIIRYR